MNRSSNLLTYVYNLCISSQVHRYNTFHSLNTDTHIDTSSGFFFAIRMRGDTITDWLRSIHYSLCCTLPRSLLLGNNAPEDFIDSTQAVWHDHDDPNLRKNVLELWMARTFPEIRRTASCFIEYQTITHESGLDFVAYCVGGECI